VGAARRPRGGYSEAPPRHEYHLTDAGRALLPVLDQLLLWGRTWAVAIGDPDLNRHRTVRYQET